MRALLSLTLLCGVLLPSPASTAREDAKFLTLEEALELAFPECSFERENVFLTEEQRESTEKLAGDSVDSRLFLRFTATSAKEGEEPELAGWAYLDTHKVRAKRESLLILVNPDDSLRRLELLAFAEPHEYLPRDNWYAQFLGKRLNADLRLRRDIKPITGATLTAEATTSAVRRVLSVHRVTLRPEEIDDEESEQ